MQDYKFVYRNLWTGQNVAVGGQLYVQNATEFQDYLNETYLQAGYKVHTVSFLGEVPVNELEQANSPKAMRFVYHLVKDVN